jgi:hypothetical protein
MSSCWYQLSLLRAQDPDISLHWYTYLQTAALVVPLPISLSFALMFSSSVRNVQPDYMDYSRPIATGPNDLPRRYETS